MKYLNPLYILFASTFIYTSVTASILDDVHQSWSAVLEKFVDNEGRIDFTALKEDKAELEKYVAYIAETSPESNPELFPTRADVLTYHINTYNALAMHGILEKNVTKGFNSFFKRAGFFKLYKITIGGKTTSLYDYENEVIRPLGEPRIHFALNCMVKDCPRLPRKPFKPDNLDEQLENVTWEFFSKDKHLRVDHEKKELWVSAILKFYTKDFVSSGKRQDLLGYVNQYLEEKIPDDYRVRFIKYDWTLNQQPDK
jgi:hypothetical protein